ncbi:MAG: SAM-dependent methyltransferase [Pseudomonadota bacterium]
MIAAAYRAAEGFHPELAEELARSGRTISEWCGPLALSPEPPAPAAWAIDIWTAPQEAPLTSIKAGADLLRGIQRNWAHLPALHHRRSALLAERLPPIKPHAIAFPEPVPTAHLGAWTLLAPDRLLYSPTKASPFPASAPTFIEDRENPPSRAYLKLWEGLTRINQHPQPGETCLDLGAAPGGWTWALAKLGATVTAIDKAPLAPNVAAMPNVTWRQDSAFSLDPAAEPPPTWLFSDIICYPHRLFTLVHRWHTTHPATKIVCSIKFQGSTDHDIAAQFAAIPGAQLFHSTQNKHELTCAIVG